MRLENTWEISIMCNRYMNILMMSFHSMTHEHPTVLQPTKKTWTEVWRQSNWSLKAAGDGNSKLLTWLFVLHWWFNIKRSDYFTRSQGVSAVSNFGIFLCLLIQLDFFSGFEAPDHSQQRLELPEKCKDAKAELPLHPPWTARSSVGYMAKPTELNDERIPEPLEFRRNSSLDIGKTNASLSTSIKVLNPSGEWWAFGHLDANHTRQFQTVQLATWNYFNASAWIAGRWKLLETKDKIAKQKFWIKFPVFFPSFYKTLPKVPNRTVSSHEQNVVSNLRALKGAVERWNPKPIPKI